MMNTNLVGSEELRRKLQDLVKKDLKAALRKSTRAAAKIIQQAAIAAAPEATGVLKRNIKVRSMKRSRKFTGTQVIEKSPHAGFTEFGTKFIKGGHSIEGAFEQVKGQAEATMLSILNDEIIKAASK